MGWGQGQTEKEEVNRLSWGILLSEVKGPEVIGVVMSRDQPDTLNHLCPLEYAGRPKNARRAAKLQRKEN